MKPVMIHADGTDCHHEGPPQSAVHDDEGPRCAGGLLVTGAPCRQAWFTGWHTRLSLPGEWSWRRKRQRKQEGAR